jgi:hypothetical protein
LEEENNTLCLSSETSTNRSIKGGNITKHECGRKSREDVPTKMLATEHEVGAGVAIVSLSTNTLISNEQCRVRTGSRLCSDLDTGRAKTFSKLFEIFERDPAKRVAYDRIRKMGSANKQPKLCTPKKLGYKANQKINLLSPSTKRK